MDFTFAGVAKLVDAFGSQLNNAYAFCGFESRHLQLYFTIYMIVL